MNCVFIAQSEWFQYNSFEVPGNLLGPAYVYSLCASRGYDAFSWDCLERYVWLWYVLSRVMEGTILKDAVDKLADLSATSQPSATRQLRDLIRGAQPIRLYLETVKNRTRSSKYVTIALWRLVCYVWQAIYTVSSTARGRKFICHLVVGCTGNHSGTVMPWSCLVPDRLLHRKSLWLHSVKWRIDKTQKELRYRKTGKKSHRSSITDLFIHQL